MQARNARNARGIDVSHQQGHIDWKKVKSGGISFAFCKATEGTTFNDPMFFENIHNAKNNGIKIGAYHFLRAGTAEQATEEANHFISVVQKAGGFNQFDLPPVVDVEVSENTVSAVKAWISRVTAATGKQPMIYTFPSFIDEHLDASLGNVPLWYANYSEEQPRDRGGWKKWTFLQYSDKGEVPGISGKVDLDEYDQSAFEESAAAKTASAGELSVQDANAIIGYLSAAYETAQAEEKKTEIHRLANELRKLSGQPIA